MRSKPRTKLSARPQRALNRETSFHPARSLFDLILANVIIQSSFLSILASSTTQVKKSKPVTRLQHFFLLSVRLYPCPSIWDLWSLSEGQFLSGMVTWLVWACEPKYGPEVLRPWIWMRPRVKGQHYMGGSGRRKGRGDMMELYYNLKSYF